VHPGDWAPAPPPQPPPRPPPDPRRPHPVMARETEQPSPGPLEPRTARTLRLRDQRLTQRCRVRPDYRRVDAGGRVMQRRDPVTGTPVPATRPPDPMSGELLPEPTKHRVIRLRTRFHRVFLTGCHRAERGMPSAAPSASRRHASYKGA